MITPVMESAFRILYCHCKYAQVVPKEQKEQVLRALCDSGVAFEAVADLCGTLRRAERSQPSAAREQRHGEDRCLFPARLSGCSTKPALRSRWTRRRSSTCAHRPRQKSFRNCSRQNFALISRPESSPLPLHPSSLIPWL